MITAAFVCLTVFAVTGWAAAAVALYLLARFSIAQGRFDTDAQQKAWNLSRAIDAAVQNRIVLGRVNTIAGHTGSGAPDTTPQARGRVDEVHEYEREANRLRDDDGEAARDEFAEQPEIMEG